MNLDVARRFVYFVLGVALILDAVVQAGSNVSEMVVGLVLFGLIPVDTALARVGRRPYDAPAAAVPMRRLFGDTRTWSEGGETD